MKNFYGSAHKLSKNPLGIIALFLILVYALVSLVAGFGNLSQEIKIIFLIYLLLFPIIVLRVFYVLVTKYHDKLYAPSDFKDDRNFLDVMELGLKRSDTTKYLSEKIINELTEKIKSDVSTNQVKAEIEKTVMKSLLIPYGALTVKVLYYSLDGRVEFDFEKKDSVSTIFDGKQKGGYLYTVFFENYMDLHNKGIITITGAKPFKFTISDIAKAAVKELYEEVFMKDEDDEKIFPRVGIGRVEKP